MIDFTEKDGAVIFAIRVVPRASRTEVAGEMDGALRVRISAPPVDGAANDELIKFVAKRLGVSRSDVEITSGNASKQKLLKIAGVTAEQLRASLFPLA